MKRPRPHGSVHGAAGWRPRQTPGACRQSGQALVFGALTLFMVAAFVIFIADLGVVTSTRIQVQNAADECAYAGALYESNVISAVAYVNEAMAHLYYDALRYAVDTTRTGVLASLKRYGPPYPSATLVYDDQDADAPGFVGDPVANYLSTFDRAREWLPRIERTLSTLARWEWGMALGCADVVKMEVWRTARRHGIEAVAIYPSLRFYPGDGCEFDLHILRLLRDGEGVGWRVWNQEGYTIEARNVGTFHWVITDPNRKVFDIERLSETTWRIQTNTDDITIERFSDRHVRVQRIRQTRSGAVKTVIDTRYVEGFGWAATITDPAYSIDYRPFEHGGYWLQVVDHKAGTSASAALRIGPDGHLQHWTGGGWADVPGQRDTVTLGGAEVPVGIDPRVIRFGDGDYFRFPNEFHLSGITYRIPIHTIEFPGGRATLLENTVRVEGWLEMPTPCGSRRVHFVMDEFFNELLVHGVLRTYHVPRDATCRWYSTRDGHQRDRLCRNCQLGQGECDAPADEETEWTYQYRRDKSYFGREDLRRFAHHALCDRDAFAQSHGFRYPQWAAWYDTALGEPRGTEYYQTRPQWGAPPNCDTDGDGEDDAVRIYAHRTGALEHADERPFDPHCRMVKPWHLRVGRTTTRFVPPLRLNEPFFYFALTVGCWRGTTGRTHPASLLRNPSWGFVGAASARAGFLELVSEEPRDEPPQFRFTWPLRTQVERFVAVGYENLYEPVWTAHLWPMPDAIRDDHIRAFADNQTGLSYLLEGLLRTYWYEPLPPDQIGHTPNERADVPGILRRMGLDAACPAMRCVVQH